MLFVTEYLLFGNRLVADFHPLLLASLQPMMFAQQPATEGADCLSGVALAQGRLDRFPVEYLSGFFLAGSLHCLLTGQLPGLIDTMLHLAAQSLDVPENAPNPPNAVDYPRPRNRYQNGMWLWLPVPAR